MTQLVRWTCAAMVAGMLGVCAATAEAQTAGEIETATEPTWILVGIGGGALLAEYVGELVATAAMGGSPGELERMAIPFVGPWLELAEGEDLRWWEIAVTVYEGAMQLVALGVLIAGLAWQQPVGGVEAPASSEALRARSAWAGALEW